MIPSQSKLHSRWEIFNVTQQLKFTIALFHTDSTSRSTFSYYNRKIEPLDPSLPSWYFRKFMFAAPVDPISQLSAFYLFPEWNFINRFAVSRNHIWTDTPWNYSQRGLFLPFPITRAAKAILGILTVTNRVSLRSNRNGERFPFRLDATIARTSTRILAEKGRVTFRHLSLQEDPTGYKEINRSRKCHRYNDRLENYSENYNYI